MSWKHLFPVYDCTDVIYAWGSQKILLSVNWCWDLAISFRESGQLMNTSCNNVVVDPGNSSDPVALGQSSANCTLLAQRILLAVTC